MLTRSNDVAPREEYFADSLLKQPTIAQSVFDNLGAGFATAPIAAKLTDKTFAQKPEGRAVKGILDSVDLENNTPGMSTSQWLLAQGSNMLGQALNPASWVLGEAGGALIGRGVTAAASKIAPDSASVFMRTPLKDLVSEPIAKYIPEKIGKEGAEKPLSLSLMSEDTLNNFGTFAGASVPQSITDNYNEDTNHISWGGVARESGEMGAFGMAIGSIPFGWGVLRGKINRAVGEEPMADVDQSRLDKALADGHINQKEHQLGTDYLENQKNPGDVQKTQDIQKRFTEIINENGHTANTVTNEALFEILKPDDVSNLQSVVADQLASDMPEPYKTSLSDFIIHNRLDYMRQNPKWLDGVRGYVDHINQKLAMKNPKLEEANKILDDHMLKKVKENMPFSQKELFKHMKKAGFEASHIKQLPVTIPENMARHLKIQEKLYQLNKKVKMAIRKGLLVNKQTARRIEELEKSLPKILTPKEELAQLRKTLIGEKGLPSNWERSNAYHRLVDLSHVWHNARTLLDRVHLESEYNRQTAFRDLAHQVLRIADSDMPRMASPDNVMDYLKNRIENSQNKVEPLSDVNRDVDAQQSVPTDAEAVLSEQRQQFEKSAAQDAKKDFDLSTDKYTEFKSSENIFKNLISCVLGGLNG